MILLIHSDHNFISHKSPDCTYESRTFWWAATVCGRKLKLTLPSYLCFSFVTLKKKKFLPSLEVIYFPGRNCSDNREQHNNCWLDAQSDYSANLVIVKLNGTVPRRTIMAEYFDYRLQSRVYYPDRGTQWAEYCLRYWVDKMEHGSRCRSRNIMYPFLYKRGHCFCFCVISSELNGHQKWDWTMHGKIKYSHLEVHQSISPKYIVFSPSPQTYCFSFVLFWKSSGHILSVVYQEK